MSDASKDKKKKHAEKLRDYFYGWQCRIRQHAVRKADGRPSPGMQTTFLLKSAKKKSEGASFGPIVTGLVKRDSVEVTSEFRHIVRKTHDPNLRHQSATKLLSSVYYQHPREFDDCVIATFAHESELVERLINADKVELHFEQHQQQFMLRCSVEDMPVDSDAYQSTYWHNRMFNPVMPASIKVLKFVPDWRRCNATPDIH